MNVTAIITARIGSKRLPKKNLKELAGRPLVDWTLKAVEESGCIDHAFLSSDSDEILKRCLKFSKTIPLKRPAALASDTATSVSVVDHVLDVTKCRGDAVMLLQPTSPFRDAKHIDEAVRIFSSSQCQTLVSVCKNEGAINHLLVVENGRLMRPFKFNRDGSERSQDQVPLYRLNGGIYLSTISHFERELSFLDENTVLYEMDRKSSIDIDDAADFEWAEFIAGYGGRE
jgi:CMP-N-acetylneuraminic acid synthetase